MSKAVFWRYNHIGQNFVHQASYFTIKNYVFRTLIIRHTCRFCTSVPSSIYVPKNMIKFLFVEIKWVGKMTKWIPRCIQNDLISRNTKKSTLKINSVQCFEFMCDQIAIWFNKDTSCIKILANRESQWLWILSANLMVKVYSSPRTTMKSCLKQQIPNFGHTLCTYLPN